MEHVHTNQAGGSHGSLKTYLIGFVLSIILTVIPFALVMSGSMPKSTILLGISAAAIVQIVVHLVFFLHLDGSSEQKWNTMVFALTALIMAILVGGTVWIMYNLEVRMMDHGKPAQHMQHH